jgi:sugar/nucleoside kinase (ribokinase family)
MHRVIEERKRGKRMGEERNTSYCDNAISEECMKYLVANTPIKLAVVGDLCLDLAYRVTTDGAETSVETGLQGYSVLQSTSTLGGACNVALNCRNLNADEVDLYGIVGNDLFSSVLHRLTVDAGIRVEGVITQDENWSTHVYHKVFEGDREHPRFDSGNFNLPSNESIELLFRRLEENIERYDAVIINEQVPQGVHNSFFQERMLALIASYPDVLWIADCRKLNEVYKDVIHKLNEDEGRRIIDYKGDDKSELASRLYRYFNKPVVMTLGENGAIVATEDETVRLDGLHLGGRIDSVGAGDAFLGAFAVTVSRGASLVEAAAIANVAASVSLKVLFGCGNPTVEEVIALAQAIRIFSPQTDVHSPRGMPHAQHQLDRYH